MEDKVLDLIEKMYMEMQEIKDGLSHASQSISKTNQSMVRLEDKMDTNFKALFDGYAQTYEKLVTLEDKVEQINNKVDRQDVRIEAIKGIAK